MSFTPGSLMVHLALASLLGLAVVICLVRLLAVGNPAHRAALFAWVLAAPVVAFAVHSTVPHDCSFLPGLPYGAHIACAAGRWLGLAGLAIMAAGLAVVVVQAGAAAWGYYRLLSSSTPVAEVREGAARSDEPCRPSTHQVALELAGVCARAGVRPPGLLFTRLPGACCTTGILRPSVVVSESLVHLLEPDEIRAVLAHEVAHVIRRDNAVGLLAGLLRALTFFSPAAHYTLLRYLAEREKAADDLAVRMCGDAVALASGLLKVYRAQGTRRLPRAIESVAAAGDEFTGRVRRLLARGEEAPGGGAADANAGAPAARHAWRALVAAIAVSALMLYLC